MESHIEVILQLITLHFKEQTALSGILVTSVSAMMALQVVFGGVSIWLVII